MKSFLTFLLLAVLWQATSEALGGTEQNDLKSTSVLKSGTTETPSPWEVRIGIPGWLSGIDGQFGVRGLVTNVNIPFVDLLRRMDAVAVLSLYARYGRWEWFGDGQYVKVSDSVQLPGLLFTNASLEMKQGFAEQFAGYRVVDLEKFTLSCYAGARYNYMQGGLSIAINRAPRFPELRQSLGIPNSLQISGAQEWVDPVIGTGAKVYISAPISAFIKGDIGGFGAASCLTWQVQGGMGFQISRWFWVNLAWRCLQYDYTNGGFTNKTALNGPLLESGVAF
jgi:hypothetical protein